MKKVVLKSQKRTSGETSKYLKESKQIPGVVYGPKHETISIKIGSSETLKTYRVTGSNQILTLDVEGEKIDVLFHELQRAPVSGDIIHVDFFAIAKGEKIHTHIPLIFIGASKAKVEEWAIIEEVLRQVEVRCLPEDLVSSFEVDLGKLDHIGDNIKVGDLGISDKYELITHKEEVIVIASKPKVEVIEDTAPEATEVWSSVEEKKENE